MTEQRADRERLAAASLDRLADLRGDITREVMQRYYAAVPDARASFALHGLGEVGSLEARMVAESVFLLLRWIEDPAAARIEQGTTVVHHNDTLEIGPRWYFGLIDAVLAVLDETIPPDATNERELWADVRRALAEFIDSLRPEFYRTIDPRPLGFAP